MANPRVVLPLFAVSLFTLGVAAQSAWWYRLPTTPTRAGSLTITARANDPMARLTRTGRWEGNCAGHLDTRRGFARIRVTRYLPIQLRVQAGADVFAVVRGPSGGFRCVAGGAGLDLRAVGDHGVWLGGREAGDAQAELRLIPMNVAYP